MEARSQAEARVAELEGKLAEDWANMDVLAAHRAARDELKELLDAGRCCSRGQRAATVTKRTAGGVVEACTQ